jgi:hypothetical protein
MMLAEQNTTSRKAAGKRREARYWAAVLIWAGLVFGADRLDVLPQVGQMDAWNWVFFGAGLFALVGTVLRATSPDKPDPAASLWDFVWAGVLLILGLSGLTTLKIGFPLILLLIGLVLLVTTLSSGEKSPS